jgi:hypothetical protein
MTIGFDEINLERQGLRKIVMLRFKKRLTKDDYDEFVPQLEWLMSDTDPIGMLVELVDFEGASMGALWKDTKFAARHFKGVDRLAVVGNRSREKSLPLFAKPFIAAEVAYFDANMFETALQWVRKA